MTKTLIVPDIHLKTGTILSMIKQLVTEHSITKIVFLGDYFDDWGRIHDNHAYLKTIRDLLEFAKERNCHFLVGNHDANYLIKKFAHYNNPAVGYAVYQFLEDVKASIAVNVGEYIVSHAGFAKKPEGWMYEPAVDHLDNVQRLMRSNYSPLWIRPNDLNGTRVKPQIVGHTPVQEIENVGGIIYTDVFSTYPNGVQIGKSEFIIVDELTSEITSVAV